MRLAGSTLNWFPAAAVSVMAVAIAGCGGASGVADTAARNSERAVIREKSTPLRTPESPVRVVVAGDTLYSIAWENGRDFRELASWNGISAPYVIKPGQRLRLLPPGKSEASVPAKTPEAVAKSSRPHSAGLGGSAAKGAHSGSTAKSATPSRPSRSAATNTRTPAQKPIPSPRSSSPGTVRKGHWAWPTDGRYAPRKSNHGAKGLDIGGTRGEPVRATADGRVVYQGSGLRGYGQLIIIKHSDEFLSAYAHNDKIFVKEGETVKRGQQIAAMGSSGTDRVKLHFEIRRHGAPVDPLKYLPRR